MIKFKMTYVAAGSTGEAYVAYVAVQLMIGKFFNQNVFQFFPTFWLGIWKFNYRTHNTNIYMGSEKYQVLWGKINTCCGKTTVTIYARHLYFIATVEIYTAKSQHCIFTQQCIIC